MLGSFTTFSTFSIEVVHLLGRGQPVTAVGYIAGSSRRSDPRTGRPASRVGDQMILLLVTLAGAFGASVPYLLSGFVQQRVDSDLPAGTLAVNLSGAFLIGIVARINDLQSSATLIMTGFLGGFTTFST